MTTLYPVRFMWTNDHVMRPMERFASLARKQFQVGEVYSLEVREARSSASHAHYFACVDDAWENLSPEQTEQFKTSDHLRGWALIETGFYIEEVTECGTHEEALHVAAITRRLFNRKAPELYIEIRVKGNIVVERYPRSQALQAMDKDEFQRSKTAVLNLLADSIGVTRKELEQQGR